LLWQVINLIIVFSLIFIFSDSFPSIWSALFVSVLLGYSINAIFIIRLLYFGRSSFT